MLVSLPDISRYGSLSKTHLDCLLGSGVPLTALNQSEPLRVARGFKAPDGRFDEDPNGPLWLVFREGEDLVYWKPRCTSLATWNGRAFALGEAAIDDASTCALGHYLNVFADPLDWLRANRDGCVVINWRIAFDRLRHVPRIAIDESLLPIYRRAMRPDRTPRLFIRGGQ